MEAFSVHGNIKAPSRRMISLAPSITELLYYLGLGKAMVGVTRQCNYPPEVNDADKVGSFLIPDIKRILEQTPDTVVGLTTLHRHLPEMLRNEDICVILLDYHSVHDILDVMEGIASLAVDPATGLKLVATLRARVNVLEAAKNRFEPVRTLFLISESPIMIPARNSYQYDALQIAGAIQVSNGYTQYERVTLEEVVYFDPEVILACGRYRGEPAPKICPDCKSVEPICQRIVDDIALRPKWQESSAAKNGRIMAIPCHWLCRPGPRLIEGMAEINKILRDYQRD
jgi:iron complex transport system substrate-binding protein